MVDKPLKGAASSLGSGGGAAAAPAPETSGTEAAGAGKRRSDRVMLSIPIEVTATDLAGRRFTEPSRTEMVSRHGASIVLSKVVSLQQPIRLRRRALDEDVSGRILGQLGIRSDGPVYGVAFATDAPNFWGISFPPPASETDGLPRVLLMCSGCLRQRIFALNEIEFRVFETNQRLSCPCETCDKMTAWTPVPDGSSGAVAIPQKGPQDRQFQRTKVKMMACIQEQGSEADAVQVLDVSRGGISFLSKRAYEKDGWINVAVPYTPGTANIFVAGMIARKQAAEDGYYEYGVKYVKG